MNLTRTWNNYWFKPAPLIHLAIARIAIVGFQIIFLILKNYPLKLYDHSLLPDVLYAPPLVSRLLLFPFGWGYRPPYLFWEILFWVTLLAGVLALIGLKTNPSLLIFALGNILMQANLYSFGDFHHPDALMMLALLALALGPSGKVLSLDRYLEHKPDPAGVKKNFWIVLEEKSVLARWPLLLIQWIYAFIYLSGAISKLGTGGLAWLNGYTLQYYLLQDGLRWNVPLGIWLGQQHGLAVLMSWMTILFEGTFFLVLFFPQLALLYVPMGIGLHLGISLTMKTHFSQYLVIYVVFVPWVALFKALSSRLSATLPQFGGIRRSNSR